MDNRLCSLQFPTIADARSTGKNGNKFLQVNLMKIYLDNCCFNRPFDDQSQLRIRLETESKLHIQEKILQKKFKLAWSYMLDFENDANPFEQRKSSIKKWKQCAAESTKQTEEILNKAYFFGKQGIKSKDSLHLACAISLNCEYFLTTDDQLLKKTSSLQEITVMNPISFIMGKNE
jgi:predicted nucleic acid-binding protein